LRCRLYYTFSFLSIISCFMHPGYFPKFIAVFLSSISFFRVLRLTRTARAGTTHYAHTTKCTCTRLGARIFTHARPTSDRSFSQHSPREIHGAYVDHLKQILKCLSAGLLTWHLLAWGAYRSRVLEDERLGDSLYFVLRQLASSYLYEAKSKVLIAYCSLPASSGSQFTSKSHGAGGLAS